MVSRRWGSRWLNGIGVATLALVLLATAAVGYAPHLPRLLWEGYPQPFWPAAGNFATLAGGDGIAPPAGSPHSPNADLAAMFAATEGRALIAAHDGRIVLEHYAPGFDRDTKLNSYSLAKSLVGALVLKAIAERRIAALEAPIGTLLPELADKPIGRVPLCHVVNMTSGIGFEPTPEKQLAGPQVKDFEATRLNLFGPMGKLHVAGLAAVIDRLSKLEPGNTGEGCSGRPFSYQNINTALAGAILERAYGRPLEQLVAEKLWRPAGAAPASWRRFGPDLPATPYCCIYARPIDWLKVALYVLANGTANQRFLPEPLWRRFLGLDIAPEGLVDGEYRDFTYHNILDRPGEPLAGAFAYWFGSRGQIVYLMPTEKLVVVRFGGSVQKLHSTLYAVGRSILAPQPQGRTAASSDPAG